MSIMTDRQVVYTWIDGCTGQKNHPPSYRPIPAAGFHHTAQNSMQLKICKMHISKNFYSILCKHSCPKVSEIAEGETTDKGSLLSERNLGRNVEKS